MALRVKSRVRTGLQFGPDSDLKLKLSCLGLEKHNRSRCVYVVDDEPLIARTLGEILRMRGMRVRSFTDSKEALEAARTDQPNVLISNLTMPQISGVDLARGIVGLWPSCKVLLRSWQAQDPDLEGYGFELLIRPVHPSTLLARIEHLLKEHSAVRTDGVDS